MFVSVEKVKPMMMKSNPLLASSYSIFFVPSLPTAFFLSPTSFKRCDSFARALVLDADDCSFWGKKSRERERKKQKKKFFEDGLKEHGGERRGASESAKKSKNRMRYDRKSVHPSNNK